MKIYAIAFEEVDFGGNSVVINFPLFVDEVKAKAFMKTEGLDKPGMWGFHYIQAMELVE